MAVKESWLSGVPIKSWGTNGGTFLGGPPKIVLHTTETVDFPSYASGKTAPHFTAKANFAAKRLELQQHTPLNVAARALRNAMGGVQTNRDSAFQIELVGCCDPSYKFRSRTIFWPDAPEWALNQLSNFVRRVAENCDVKLVAPKEWLPYPKSYGSKSGQRMSLSEWDNFSGVCGHQHVPENTHGDPGNIAIRQIIEPASGEVRPLPPAVRVPVIDNSVPKYPLGRCGLHNALKVFGPRSGPDHYISGYYGATDRNNLRIWQKQMRRRGWKIDVDGLFGPQTQRVTSQFQREKKLTVDSLIGPNTWQAAWALRVT